ncbi:MAG: hypothetical protein R6X25_07985 [Candidatus Krumholzibacteriia bacterium]
MRIHRHGIAAGSAGSILSLGSLLSFGSMAAVVNATVLAAMAILPAAVVVIATAHAGEVAVIDGVPHVRNGAVPDGGVRTLELEELWRRGGWDDEEVMFGAVRRAVVDESDTIYLLDSQLSEVKVLSPEGELVAVLGREGEGPGEFRNATDLCLLPDGTVAVTQMFPGRIVRLARDGTPAGTITVGDPAQGAFYMARALRRGGENVVLGGAEQHVDQAAGRATRESFIATFDTSGQRKVTYASRLSVIDHRNLSYDEVILGEGPDRRFAVGPRGEVVTAEARNGYEVRVYAPGGELRRVFTRDYRPWLRNEQARDIQRRILTTLRDRQAPHASIHFEDTEPDIASLRVDEHGRIWVQTSRALWEPAPGVFTRYDVFTPDGRFAEQVLVRCEGDPRQDGLLFARSDLVFRITGYRDAMLSGFGGAGGEDDGVEPEPMQVICYRVRDRAAAG